MPPAAALAKTDPAPAASPGVPEDHARAYLRMVSHELRTPLNSILGFSEILASELHGPLGSPQYREYAQIIHGSGQQLLKLVNQVLEIARLEAKAVQFDPHPEPLDAAFDDALALTREEMSALNLAIAITCADPAPVAMADPIGLRTVLVNLIRNAVAASPPEGEVRLMAERADQGVAFTIENDGEGLDAAGLQSLVMSSAPGTLVRRGDGAGLAIRICMLTCEQLGGRFSLQSEPGRGMTARVWLPTG